MAVIKDLNTIIQNHIDFLRANQPDADVKSGTVIRDLFVDLPSTQLAFLYTQLGTLSGKYSVKNYFGTDLDNYVQPYGIIRKQAQPSTGTAIFTFASIPSPILLKSGSTVTAANGISFSISSTIYVDSSNLNTYKAIAQKYANDLSYLGITDQYAVEVNLTANIAGTVGSIAKYSLQSVSIVGVSNVFNTAPFTGEDSESDTDLQNRFLSSQTSIAGTNTGLFNTVLSVNYISDAYIVEAGNPLMTRDGTVVDSSGNIVSEGTGGKTDVICLGIQSQQGLDTYIYKDKSNIGDPTDSRNNYVLGQIPGDINKTITAKRRDDLATGILPNQPVQNILQVSGSSSGANYVEQTIDEYGRKSGNYKLIKDTGDFAGSPWGYDTFAWTSNYVNIDEDHSKGNYNGQDALNYTDVIDIPNITQTISISSENSNVLTDNSQIQLLHYPVSAVSRVQNATTGERYTIISLNLDPNQDNLNVTGVIQISGNTLPAPTDILQVDYSWVTSYDPNNDYDGKSDTTNIRNVTDSIDWGYSNQITENIEFVYNATTGINTGYASHIIDSLSSLNQYTTYNAIVSIITSGQYLGRYQINLQTSSEPDFPTSIKILNTNIEVFNLPNKDYLVSYNSGIWTIILPSDVNQYLSTITSVVIYTNKIDLSSNANISGNQIMIPSPSNTNVLLEAKYFCNSQNIITTNPNGLNSLRNGNGLIINYSLPVSTILQSSPTSLYNNIINREFQTVKYDGTYKYINFNPTTTNYNIDVIFSIVRKSDGKDLYDSTQNIYVDSNGLYRINVLSTAVTNDIVLVNYTVVSETTIQPLTETVNVISKNIYPITGSGSPQILGLVNTIAETVSVQIFNATLNTFINATGTISASLYNNIATITLTSAISLTTNCYYQLIITSATHNTNNGTFEIVGIDSTNKIVSYRLPNLSNITNKEILLVNCTTGSLINFTRTIDSNNNDSISFTQLNNVFVQLFINNFRHLRNSAIRYKSVINGPTNQSGAISIAGTTLTKFNYSIPLVKTLNTSSTSTSIIDLTQALYQALIKYGYTNYANDLIGNQSLSSMYGIGKVVSLEQVDVIQSNQEITNVNFTYDIAKYRLQYNTYDSDNVIEDNTLDNFQLGLQSNITNNSTISSVGQYINVSFYFYIVGDSETLSYVSNSSLYTNKKFITNDFIKTISGFTANQSTTLAVTNISQPAQNARYTANYSYNAPKQNERISLTYNYNLAIINATLAIENKRFTNQDVLAKAAQELEVDISINITVLATYLSSATTIVQSVYNVIVNSTSLTSLGASLNQSTIIVAAKSVTGVDDAIITHFNLSGIFGNVESISAANNQYIAPGVISVNLVSS
jgi:acyl-CoA thioesterase